MRLFQIALQAVAADSWRINVLSLCIAALVLMGLVVVTRWTTGWNPIPVVNSGTAVLMLVIAIAAVWCWMFVEFDRRHVWGDIPLIVEEFAPGVNEIVKEIWEVYLA